ncbi:insulinoma-associated protein 1-like [Pygocentrus nattereri]|uniref:C2H2-type domain-containing protein n=1 Tax=Pygocentrus nattereri TaxID=42514 RepID=A0A3B4DDW0_PYGNA|nr:insulinoma-associated protein 1-like [Pygocentrus nattereri]
MPKGFLVKRSKRTGPASYRVREEESTPQDPQRTAPALPSDPRSFVQRTPARCCFGGLPELSFLAPSLSPTRPDSEGYSSQHPAHQHPELFPEPLLGGFAINGSPVSPSLPETTAEPASFSEPPKKRAAPNNEPPSASKKPRSSSNQERRANVRDAVTTSPVLGLRIKEVEPEEEPKRLSSSSPLGEFVCQLCKERYPDPLSLAHHKCSRIVRVEYRCDECDKAFSCPANLASHRRWHKPKGAGLSEAESRLSPRPQPSPPSSEDDTPFGCPRCSKRFRRQAYLRKHLALHDRKEARVHQAAPHALSAEEPRPPTTELSPELSPGLDAAEAAKVPSAAMFPCRFCGENFFSSPGLTRHINQHHPTESRQMILLSNAV